MIHSVMENWHAHMRGNFPGGLDELLHDDCVFWSPVVFAGQEGKELTKLYLGAAGNVFPGDAPGAAADNDGKKNEKKESSFRYVKEILDGNHAVLEFETMMGDVSVNGIDMITCDDDGKIIEFKVMIRPLRAINKVHEQMGQMLEKMQG